MLSIVVGVVAIVFRKRLAASTIRQQERLWRARYIGKELRLLEWMWAGGGVLFILFGVVPLVWPQ